MSETTQPTQRGDAAKPKRRGRALAWVGGGAAVVLVAAGFTVPQAIHAQHVSEYTELVVQHDDALVEQANAQTMLDAATALAPAQQSELKEFGERLVAVGTTAEPILAAAQTKELTEAGHAVVAIAADAAEAGEADPADAVDEDAAAAPASDPLVKAVDVLRGDDLAAQTAANEAGEESPEPTAPATYLSLNTANAAAIIKNESAPKTTQRVADDDVTVELIEAMTEQLAATHSEITRIEGLISAEEARMAGYRDAVADAVPVLRAAVETTAAQAEQVVKTTPKAPDVAATAVAAAKKVQNIAEVEDAAQMLNGLVAYVDASRAAQVEHAAVVKREAAEAAKRAEANRKVNSNRNNSSNKKKRKNNRLCSRFRPSPGGGGTLVLVYC